MIDLRRFLPSAIRANVIRIARSPLLAFRSQRNSSRRGVCSRFLAMTGTAQPASVSRAVGVLIVVGVALRAMRLAAGWLSCAVGAPLRHGVGDVLSVRANEQVRAVYARRIVAVMADFLVGRHRPMCHLPRYPVRGLSAARARDPNDSVALAVCARHPQPAARSEHGMDWAVFVDLLPETFSKWTRFHGANIRCLRAFSYENVGVAAW